MAVDCSLLVVPHAWCGCLLFSVGPLVPVGSRAPCGASTFWPYQPARLAGGLPPHWGRTILEQVSLDAFSGYPSERNNQPCTWRRQLAHQRSVHRPSYVGRPPHLSCASTDRDRTNLTTQLCVPRFNGRTAQPLGSTPASGCDELTSRCQTMPSIWDSWATASVIPNFLSVRATTHPRAMAGSLVRFAPARPVGPQSSPLFLHSPPDYQPG